MFKIILISFASFSNSQKISKEGEMCGGMLSDPHQCANGLECVNTRGPMIADAPGVCHPKCETFRDSWGECVPKNCDIWNNGCNVCGKDPPPCDTTWFEGYFGDKKGDKVPPHRGQ